MKKIAVIGSGIAGLTSAYYLSQHHEIQIFEANDYIGGHTHTVAVDWQGEQSAIDTGFIVFNDRTYPNFMRLLSELGVAYQKTEMSFSVRNDSIGLEYNGHNLNSLFAQRKNLLSPVFWRMLKDITRFNRDVRRQASTALTIGDYLDNRDYDSLFKDNYLLPMIAAIWSMGLEESRDFPLEFFVRFFENHGLLDISGRPQWFSIVGSSHAYIPAITRKFLPNITLSTPVRAICREPGGIRISTDRDEGVFDEVILACHADQALAMISRPTQQEEQVLQAIPFTDNLVTLHTDTGLMPHNSRAWASWNYKVNPDNLSQPTLTYDMNRLQCLNKQTPYLVTLNEEINEDKVIQRFNYSHPAFTCETLQAQARWHEISGVDRLHFCGAYWFNGFHEDGVRSALRVCDALGVSP